MSSIISSGWDEVVLTGLSGRLPESDNIEQFAEQLFAGVDLVTTDDRRWTPGLHGLPERSGKLKDLAHFDAIFFGVHAKQANVMDPQQRMLLEVAHEAIVDAGLSPAELRGSRTGVYVAVGSSESQEAWNTDPDTLNGYVFTGCVSSMLPNRVSYTYDLKGPSIAVDTACSSSMTALTLAVDAIRAGQCDAAIVAGTNLCLNPVTSVNFNRLNTLSPESRCAVFDSSADGYVRSEAVVAVLLQRRRNARRLYCTVREARINTDGYKIKGFTHPNGEMQRQLAQEAFGKAHLRPQDVVYVEAHGTGTKVGDPEEVNGIAELFCVDRQTPLLLGSIKSNIGHAEIASGLCSVTKIVLAMERGTIPGNLHFKEPNPEIPALCDGRIKVVDKNTPWQGGLAAINSFGLGGANAHVILESQRGARPSPAEYAVPRLVLASGCTNEAVEKMLQLAVLHPHDAELHALIDAVHSQRIPMHPYRGYAVLGTPELEVLESDEGRPLWFVMSGMGSQWPSMARELLRLPTFAASITRSAEALKPHGVDLQYVIAEAPIAAFDDIINCLVSITAVQVALLDVLSELGLRPDGIIGHSLACAYVDGALTVEQAVLCAYWRGRCTLDARLAPGAMAAVGLSWDEAARRCPADVEIACDNALDNVTISGPSASVEKFVEQLSSEGVFVQTVTTGNIAFHSTWMAKVAPALLQRLKQVIPEPKPRSAFWLSTSLPQDQWNSDRAMLSDAEYHVNNLVSPVLFAGALARVPANAVLVEVAPHALLQAVLRRSMPEAAHVSLVSRDSPNALVHLLRAVGKAYAYGAQPQVSRLYPEVSWPVSRGTPGLSSHVGWDHSTKWAVADCNTEGRCESVVDFNLDENNAFIAGYNIDGRVLFPATGYILLVWRTLANMYSLDIQRTAVVFENVRLHRATIVLRDASLRFRITIFRTTGDFEVCEGGAVVATGTVRRTDDPAAERLPADALAVNESQEDLSPLDSEDIYKEFRLRGYKYKGVFCGIKSSDAFGTRGLLKWDDNWISFMDTVLQFCLISSDTRALYLPTRLQRIVIDPKAQLEAVDAETKTVPVKRCSDIDAVVSGGVEFQGLNITPAPRRGYSHASPIVEKYIFLPFETTDFGQNECSTRYALTVALQLVIENYGSLHLKLAELAFQRDMEEILLPHLMQVIEAEPSARRVRVEATLAAGADAPKYAASMDSLQVKVLNHHDVVLESCNLMLGVDVLTNGVLAATNVVPNLKKDLLATSNSGSAKPNGLPNVRHCVSASVNGAPNDMPASANNLPDVLTASSDFVLLKERVGALEESGAQKLLATAGLKWVSRIRTASCDYVLLRRAATVPITKAVIEVRDDDYAWVELLKDALKCAETEDLRVYVWSRAPGSGVQGLGTCLQREPGGDRLRVYYLAGAKDAFDPDAPMYKEQVQRDLAFNVLRDGVWGTFRHLPYETTDKPVQVESAHIMTQTRGDLSSLRWIESNRHVTVTHDQQKSLCHVYYSSLNFHDIMIATGKMSFEKEIHLAFEYSGRLLTGKRVMGMVPIKGLATTMIADETLMWEVPKHWSLEEAATVPVVYAMAYYALSVRGRMRNGETVLIHAGAGGVGQAAITIALHAGCTIFTTVGTPEKRAFLRERFPQLPDANIGNSRDCSFQQLVLRRTRGRGVDLVLNSLANDMLQASLRCLALGGRFLEIGKVDLSANSALGMAVLLKNTTVHGVMLDFFFHYNEPTERAELMRCMNEGIASGVVRPLPATVFADYQLEQAFRYMATGRHIGKVLVRVREEEDGGELALCRQFSALRRTYMHPGKSYVLVGGLGGFGLELGEWLAGRGARCLVLNSRSGVRTGYQAWCIRRWRKAGVQVLLSTDDVTTAAGARALLQSAAAQAPIGGIFNLAVVLRDAFLENQTPDDFRAVAKPKIDATRALDVASRELAPELDHFVAFSSLCCGRGNAGQSNYGLANSAMERACEQRREAGLPALAVQWGAVGDVGVLAAMHGGEDVEIAGTASQSITSCLATLDSLLISPHVVFSSLVLPDKHPTQENSTSLVQAVANILGYKDLSKIPQTATLSELGMDSLMSAEIRQTQERSYDLLLSVQEIRALTFSKLREIEASRLGTPVHVNKKFPDFPLVPEETLIKLQSQPSPSGLEDKLIFMVHPIDGVASALRELAANVRGVVYGLQCARSAPLDSMETLAAFYVRQIRDVQPHPPYTLLGYSFGASVAFEMALQLEQEGSAVRLVLVDGSPAFVLTWGVYIGLRDQVEQLAYMGSVFFNLNLDKVSAELKLLPDWDARVEHLTKLIVASGAQVEAAAFSDVARLFHYRLELSKKYKPAGRLQAPVALFRASSYTGSDEHYGLRELCTGELRTRRLAGTHQTIVTGDAARTIADYVSDILTKT